MKRKVTLVTAVLMLLTTSAIAEVPQLVTYQGRLIDTGGSPVADGAYLIRFQIYDDPTAGAVKWTSNTRQITVVDGLFSYNLGDTVAIPDDLFANDTALWIGVKVGVDPEITPRARLTSHGYAYQSLRADSAGTSLIAFDLTCASCVGASDIDETEIQRRVTGTAPGGSFITGINQDGTVVTVPEQAPSGWTDDGNTVRLTNVGDSVGIGTAGPAKKLEVAGSIKGDTLFSNILSSNSPLALQAPAGTTRIYIDDVTGTIQMAPTGGLVGIGPTTPTEELHISSSSSEVFMRFDQSSSSDWKLGNVSGDFYISGSTGGGFATKFFMDDSTGNTWLAPLGGNVGIGETSPLAKLHISSSTSSAGIRLDESGTEDWNINNSSGNFYITRSSGGGNSTKFFIDGSNSETWLVPTGGNLGVGTTSPSAKLEVQESGNTVAAFDRQNNNGVVISIQQAGTQEGTISVSGTTVSYNAFTGSHYGWTDESISRGELVSLTGTNQYYHGNQNSEIIYGIEKSLKENDPSCLGAFLALSESTEPFSTENPYLVMAVGNGEMWVVDDGREIQAGDYLISSSTPGHAMKDDEDSFAIGHIVARAAESVDWKNVVESIDGKKHKKISVLFGNFVRTNATVLNRKVVKQQERIENLETRLRLLESAMSKTRAETK